ncbi:MAG: SGNH/GDSL hydrolase family protein [Lachnospiraceae bacterium]|nr:SGNH/GDSL hydrolase family protein [Lachnospiraceae bacterium]
MKKFVVCLVMMLTLSLTLTACGGGQSDAPSEPKKEVAVFGDTDTEKKTEESVEAETSSEEVVVEPTSEEESVEEPAVEEETTPVAVPTVTGEAPVASEMVMRSLMQTGNNYRLKKAIDKAKSGEEVVIAYIGGSITEGANATPNNKCYAYRSYEYFKETFASGGDNVKFVNAGMSGTPSTIGMIRYDRDVIQKVGEPDILIVEFAVNDGDDPTNGVCYESLVLNALQAENDPAVVLLFAVFKSQWNLQDRLSPIGTYYDLPMVSIKDAVVPALKDGELTEAEFFSDVYHPTNAGHQLMADCLNYMFDVVNYEEASEKDITIPAVPKIGNAFVGVKMVDSKTSDSNVTITPGCFTGTDNAVGGFQHSKDKTFPNNWLKTSTATGDSFKMELTCKNLVMLYKSSNNQNYGKAEVYVDGEKVATLNGYAASGWNNPLLKILFNKKESAKHTIEIKMAEDSEGKAFTIMGFGYTE